MYVCVCFVCARSLAFGYQPVLALFSLHASFFWLQWSYLRAQIFYFCHHRSSKWLFTYPYERMQLGAVAVAARRFFLDSPRCWLSACGVCCFLRFKKFFSSSGFATFFPNVGQLFGGLTTGAWWVVIQNCMRGNICTRLLCYRGAECSSLLKVVLLFFFVPDASGICWLMSSFLVLIR